MGYIITMIRTSRKFVRISLFNLNLKHENEVMTFIKMALCRRKVHYCAFKSYLLGILTIIKLFSNSIATLGKSTLPTCGLHYTSSLTSSSQNLKTNIEAARSSPEKRWYSNSASTR
jgi:hypothetical protein